MLPWARSQAPSVASRRSPAAGVWPSQRRQAPAGELVEELGIAVEDERHEPLVGDHEAAGRQHAGDLEAQARTRAGEAPAGVAGRDARPDRRSRPPQRGAHGRAAAGRVGIGKQHAAAAVERDGDRPVADPGGEPLGVEVVARQHGQRPRQLPRGGRRRLLELVGRRALDEQADEVLAAALALARVCGLLAGVALDRLGGQLVDVGEDRLGQQRELVGVDAGAAGDAGQPPPGDPRAEPVSRLEGVEPPSGAQLATAELDVDAAARPAGRAARRLGRRGGRVGRAELIDELAQGLLDRVADDRAEDALHRPVVLGYVRPQRLEDLVGQAGEFRAAGRRQARDRGSPTAGQTRDLVRCVQDCLPRVVIMPRNRASGCLGLTT